MAPRARRPDGRTAPAGPPTAYDFGMTTRHVPSIEARPLRRAWRRSGLAAWTALFALAGCGGGVAIGFGGGTDFDAEPPSVSIASSAASVAAGQTVTLIAAASDDTGIDVVAFYRLDPGEQKALGTLARPPYRLSVTAPDDGRTVMRVFARAIDVVGKRTDSAVLDIPVTR